MVYAFLTDYAGQSTYSNTLLQWNTPYRYDFCKSSARTGHCYRGALIDTLDIPAKKEKHYSSSFIDGSPRLRQAFLAKHFSFSSTPTGFSFLLFHDDSLSWGRLLVQYLWQVQMANSISFMSINPMEMAHARGHNVGVQAIDDLRSLLSKSRSGGRQNSGSIDNGTWLKPRNSKVQCTLPRGFTFLRIRY